MEGLVAFEFELSRKKTEGNTAEERTLSFSSTSTVERAGQRWFLILEESTVRIECLGRNEDWGMLRSRSRRVLIFL